MEPRRESTSLKKPESNQTPPEGDAEDEREVEGVLFADAEDEPNSNSVEQSIEWSRKRR